MNKWWSDHWDRVVLAVVSMIVAGVIGFFSAIITTTSKLGDLQERVGVLEQLEETVKEEKGKTVENTRAVNGLSRRFDSMRDRVDLAETRVATIKELTELQRQKTVNELLQLLERYGNKTAAVAH